ncbi:hypothetical protein [Bifidobacterium sp.]|jgi:hypothetical protein|uniref:hypothetical protein n=1 Tax=Bifidobacterium sp. TaxID=41200 RepID=UPI0025C2B70B|nr:hypothetical protein [Bifidobacterium sp.]MCH4208805.1 hypothetical protein [Bifidobacterium sp.]MCI1224763.1 hypothetical protein [Bifidobacterium sp.]
MTRSFSKRHDSSEWHDADERHDPSDYDDYAAAKADRNWPTQELDALREFVEESWPQCADNEGPTFLWSQLVEELANQADSARTNGPVAPADQARAIMTAPLQWYLRSVAPAVSEADPLADDYAHSLDAISQDAMTLDALPTFHLETHALDGVQAVVGNAVMSRQWREAAENLALALTITTDFIGSIADREDEGFAFLKQLIQEVRVYFESLARQADPITAQGALQAITEAACNENFGLNPAQMVELLSCALPFAQWDDTRVLAYDTVHKADAVMGRMVQEERQERHGQDNSMGEQDRIEGQLRDADGENIMYPLELVHLHYEQSMLFLRHDLLRLSGEYEAADRFLAEHHDMEPFADAYAARLITQERWQELLDFSETVMRDEPNQQLMIIPPDAAPYDWDSLREAALQGLHEGEELCELYRERIVDAYGSDEVVNVSRLRAVSGKSWPRQIDMIVKEYDDGREHFTRNMAYEHLLISERLGERAWRYSRQFPKARTKLAKTIALAKPDTARRIILGPIGMDGSYDGDMPARQAVYQRIAKSLMKYATVFSLSEARSIAYGLVRHYPARPKLAQALHALLETES